MTSLYQKDRRYNLVKKEQEITFMYPVHAKIQSKLTKKVSHQSPLNLYQMNHALAKYPWISDSLKQTTNPSSKERTINQSWTRYMLKPMINWAPQPALPSAKELHVDTLLIEIEEMLSQNRVIHQMKKIGNNYKLLTFHKFPTIWTTWWYIILAGSCDYISVQVSIS